MVALCLGGASCLPEDVRNYAGPYDAVIACNDAIPWWPGDLDVAASLHPDKLPGWLGLREKNGHPAPRALAGHEDRDGAPELDLRTWYLFPGQEDSASSGLYIAKIALVDLGFDRAVLCGVPMEATPHVNGGGSWHRSSHYREKVETIPQEWRDRIAAMSGWTRGFLGGPEKWDN